VQLPSFVEFILLSAAGLALSGPGFAQAPTEPAGQTVIKSSVREVLLDVVVRDKHGKPVTNLKPEQIAVYEDGVRQNVRSFRLVKGDEVRTEDEKEAKETAAATATPETPATPAARLKLNPLRTVNLVCLVFGEQSGDTRAAALTAAKEFVNNELRPNTFIGVFGFDGAGRLHPLFPFSNNREKLLSAMDLASRQAGPLMGAGPVSVAASVVSAEMVLMLGQGGPGASVSSDTLARTLVDSSGQVIAGVADTDANDNTPLGPRGTMETDSLEGQRQVDALTRLTRQLSPLPFQKTVLLLSTGLIRPADQMQYWRNLLHAANQGGVTFYALDTWGLGVCQDESDAACLSSSGATRYSVDVLNKTAALSRQQSTAKPTLKQSMELMKQDEYSQYAVLSANQQAALRDLAESTGGFLIANTNNTEQLMKRVMEDVDTHYEVTYQPAADAYDGRFRKVEVKLSRADLQARTRNGYFALPEAHGSSLGAGEMAGLRALNTAPLPHAFDYQTRALRFRSENGTSQYAVVFNVPIAGLTGTADPEARTHRFHASLLALAKNSQGQVEDWFSRDVPSIVADKFVPALERRQMTWEHSFHLPPGHYTIETAVVDEEGNRISTAVLPVDGAAASGPDMSDLMLAQEVKPLDRAMDESDPFEVEGRRVIPLATTALPPGWTPYLYFVLYPQKDDPERARLHVQFFRNGKALANRTVAVDQPDASGNVPMLISALQQPGNYEVRIVMTQGRRASVERSLTYSVAGN
jgi:VWFA-related protein